MDRNRSLARILVVIGMMVVPIVPAGAVTSGEPDGGAHPAVACILGGRPDGSFVGCGSGQLITPKAVLIAAHEVPVLRGLGATRFFVSFDAVVDPTTSSLYEVAEIDIPPGFNTTSFAGLDLGIMTLVEPVRGITPLTLPTAGALDRMVVDGSLSAQPFVVAGYGRDCADLLAAACVPMLDTVRRAADELVISVTARRLTVQANTNATGIGGPCFGDSGSPHILGGSNTTFGATGWISGACNDAIRVTRLDTSAARSFLGAFVTLP